MSILGRLWSSVFRRRRPPADPPASAGSSGHKRLYGVMAEFENPERLVEAARRARDEGYQKMDAFTPFPVHGLDEAIGFEHTRLPLVVLLGGVLGCIAGYLLQYYGSVIDYPYNIGGRPYHSWPAFIPITFETTILGAVLAAVFGMLALNGLPQPHHPVFNVPNFELATRSHFFLCIEAADPKFDAQGTTRFLESLEPRMISEVEC